MLIVVQLLTCLRHHSVFVLQVCDVESVWILSTNITDLLCLMALFLSTSHRLPLKLRRTCNWQREEIWERREHHLCLQTLWRCCWRVSGCALELSSAFVFLRTGHQNVLPCVSRYCSCHWDPSAYRRDVLRAGPSVHTHHSPAAGMWPASKENSGQVHSAERLPQQGEHGVDGTAAFPACLVHPVTLSLSCSSRLSRAAWWRACQQRRWSLGTCGCVCRVLRAPIPLKPLCSRGQGAGPCSRRSHPDECKGGALPALPTSPYPVRLWSRGRSEHHTG